MFDKIILIGNLGGDPEMRYTPQGTAVTNFNVATNTKFKNAAGETVSKTKWFRVTAWGKAAENCANYLKKGSKVYVEGNLNADDNGNPKTFTRNDGTPGASYEVRADKVVFLTANQEHEIPQEAEAPF